MPPRRKHSLPPPERRCTARVKTCWNCKHRFPKDKSKVCSKCGADRRCPNWRYKDKTVCYQHGGPGGGPPGRVGGETAKIRVSERILAGYNRVMAHPQLLSLAQEIAIATAYNERIMMMIDEIDLTAAHRDIVRALSVMEGGFAQDDMGIVRRGMKALRSAVDPIRVEGRLRAEWRENTELQRRLVDTERKYLVGDKQDVPIAEVLEALIIVQRVAFKYIPAPQDRGAYANELRRMLPNPPPQTGM